MGHVAPGPLETGLQRGGHTDIGVMVGSRGEVGEVGGGEVVIARVMAVMSPSLPDLSMD